MLLYMITFIILKQFYGLSGQLFLKWDIRNLETLNNIYIITWIESARIWIQFSWLQELVS